jgi:hypothetical protein
MNDKGSAIQGKISHNNAGLEQNTQSSTASSVRVKGMTDSHSLGPYVERSKTSSISANRLGLVHQTDTHRPTGSAQKVRKRSFSSTNKAQTDQLPGYPLPPLRLCVV